MTDQRKSIDIGELTEVVTAAVQRALQDRTGEPLYYRPPRIICGIIFEPPYGELEQVGAE